MNTFICFSVFDCFISELNNTEHKGKKAIYTIPGWQRSQGCCQCIYISICIVAPVYKGSGKKKKIVSPTAYNGRLAVIRNSVQLMVNKMVNDNTAKQHTEPRGNSDQLRQCSVHSIVFFRFQTGANLAYLYI